MHELDTDKPQVLVNLSGGVDSTFLLWKLLVENNSVLVHHCNMYSLHENRLFPELCATYEIISWFRSNGLGNFKVITSGFDYGNLGFIVKDIEVIGFMSAVALRNAARKSVKVIAISANSSDESNNPNEPSVVRRRKILEAVLPVGSGVRLEFPVLHLSKQDMVEQMPQDLFNLTWFCRRPEYYIDQEMKIKIRTSYRGAPAAWQVCEKCTPCRVILSTSRGREYTRKRSMLPEVAGRKDFVFSYAGETLASQGSVGLDKDLGDLDIK